MTTMHSASHNGSSAVIDTVVGPTTATAMNGLSNVSSTYVNPAQMSHNAQAGPSSTNGSAKKKAIPNIAKRRRGTDTPDTEVEPSHTTQQRKNRDGPRKKKANRACFHCQKAHLTCDDTRPCQRCIKRGIGDNCTEGHRKKAKYLLDEEDIVQLKSSKSTAPDSSPETTQESPQASIPNSNGQPAPVPTSEPFPPDDPLFNVSFDPNFTFGSEAANLEYSILSAILGNPSPPESGDTPPQSQYQTDLTNGGWPSDMSQGQFGQSPVLSTNGYGINYGDTPQMSIQPSETTLNASPTFMDGYPSAMQYQTSQQDQSPEIQFQSQYAPSPQQQDQFERQPRALHPLEPRYPHEIDSSLTSTTGPVAFVPRSSSKDSIARALGSPSPSDSPASSSHVTNYTESLQKARPNSQLQSINARVTRPYDYTVGYHHLMKYLPSRFEKNDILRVVRALAIFRPSLIAMQMPLTIEDEVFVEKCFQRSLLELDKLISFSGTPTVVWRRTGEICLVTPEFCMISDWSMENLLNKGKYIYELFENQSVVEYYENFASHAFENTTQSVYSHCVILKPNGAPVPATFCFSIRRDIFDLPSLVIGTWLPLL